MNIIGFLHAICSKFTAALTMAARIWQQNRVTVFQQQVSVSRHSFAIVGNSVQQNYGIAVVVTWMDKPALERHSVSRGDRHILQLSAEISLHGCRDGLLMAQRKAMQLKAEIGYDNAGQNGQNKIGYEARDQDFAKDVTFPCW